MIIQEFNSKKLESAKRYLSTDALLIHVCDSLARRTKLSLVRMGDGEASIIKHLKGKAHGKYLFNPEWLKEYGLVGADLKLIANKLIFAAQFADFYCPNISGLVYDKYEIISLTPPRDYYCEGLYAHTWLYMGRVEELMKYNGGIGVVCRNSNEVADRLFMKYGRMDIEATDYDSWLDYDVAMDFVGQMKAHLILVSAGPSGKFFCVEAAKKFNKVVIDTGSALIRHWSVSKTKNY
jgi:hypothetical protein